ncbi:MAG: nuclear transport factor 2 family protein [Acidobacteriota bacterium]|nr:nuclear transport factor 2 family protein [Acidobacteriota bacterium]
MTPVEVAVKFLSAINSRDPDKIAALMTEDHVFVDSLGHAIKHRDKVREAWKGYFGMCPDYRVDHEDLFADGHQVAIFGKAGGTIRGQKWEIPAAWKAVVNGEQVHEWRVYADNKPVYEILNEKR